MSQSPPQTATYFNAELRCITQSWDDDCWSGFLFAIGIPPAAHDTVKKSGLYSRLHQLKLELVRLGCGNRDHVKITTYLCVAAQRYIEQLNNPETEVPEYHRCEECQQHDKRAGISGGEAPPGSSNDGLKIDTPFGTIALEELRKVSDIITSLNKSLETHLITCQAP